MVGHMATLNKNIKKKRSNGGRAKTNTHRGIKFTAGRNYKSELLRGDRRPLDATGHRPIDGKLASGMADTRVVDDCRPRADALAGNCEYDDQSPIGTDHAPLAIVAPLQGLCCPTLGILGISWPKFKTGFETGSTIGYKYVLRIRNWV